MVDDGNRARSSGAGARGQVARCHAARSEGVSGVVAVKLHLEHPGTQSRRIHRPLGLEAALISRAREVPGNAAERTRHAPGAQVEALHHRIGRPVPVTRQIERLTGEVGAERAGHVRDDIQSIEVATCVGRERPGWLPCRGPVEVTLDLHAERIGRTQRAERVDLRALEAAIDAEEADVVVADQRRATNVTHREMESVVDREHRASNLRVLGIDDEPGRQEAGRSGCGGSGAALHLDEGALHLAVRHADGLQHEWSQGHTGLDAGESEVDQVMLDLHPLDGEATGHRATHAADGEAHGAELLRDVPDHELQAALREQCRPHEHRGRRNRGEDDQNGKGEQQAAHAVAILIRASARS